MDTQKSLSCGSSGTNLNHFREEVNLCDDLAAIRKYYSIGSFIIVKVVCSVSSSRSITPLVRYCVLRLVVLQLSTASLFAVGETLESDISELNF